jgi:hypothetical protein
MEVEVREVDSHQGLERKALSGATRVLPMERFSFVEPVAVSKRWGIPLQS